jgi:hypothetical protein
MTRGRPAVTRGAKPRTRQTRGRMVPSSSTASTGSTTSSTNRDSVAPREHVKEAPESNPTREQDESAGVQTVQLPNDLLVWLSVGSPKVSSLQQDMSLVDTEGSNLSVDCVDFLETSLYGDLPAEPVIDFISTNREIAQWQLTGGRHMDSDEHLQKESEFLDLSEILTLIRPSTLLEGRLLHHCETRL